MATTKIALSKPITIHDPKGPPREIKELELRDATADDVIACDGHPFDVIEYEDGGQMTRLNVRKLKGYIDRLSGLDQGAWGQMDAADLQKVANHLGRTLFRGQGEQAVKNSVSK